MIGTGDHLSKYRKGNPNSAGRVCQGRGTVSHPELGTAEMDQRGVGLEPMGTLVLESTQRERGLDMQSHAFPKPDLSNEHTALVSPHACRVSD